MVTCQPISVYPAQVTPDHLRESAPRNAPWFDTLGTLRDELAHLEAEEAFVTIEVDVPEAHIRKDGWPRANAKPASPRVVLATPSKWGPLRFACDRYTCWRANVRGIALTLRALRELDDAPVTTMGEQYLGWAVLTESAPPTSSSATDGFLDADAAAWWMATEADAAVTAEMLLRDPKAVAATYRQLARKFHPDTPTGDSVTFRRLEAAREVLAGR